MYYPCAKINLGLNVVVKRADGYHDLETVFYPVDIHDELEVWINENETQSTIATKTKRPTGYENSGCSLEVVGAGELCRPEQNLVVKAYNLLKERYDLPGVRARLTKHIPMQAGMGGGSSDGAYMIRALNEVCSLGMTVEEMQGYAARLGADCPFFITAQPAYAEGIGERLFEVSFHENAKLLDRHHLVLIKPDVAVSTKEAYAGITPHPAEHNCREVVGTLPMSEWRGRLTNDFEDSIFDKLPILREVKEAMYDSGATYASMSGSGSTIYGLFPDSIDEEYLLTQSNISRYADKYFFKIIKKENRQ